MTEIVVRPGGTPKWTRDAGTNDSDKSFTVPTGKVWVPVFIHEEIVTTATVGTRLMQIMITDGTNPRWVSPQQGATASQNQVTEAATNFDGYVTTIPTITYTGVSPNAKMTVFLPAVTLPAASVIRVYDAAAIDAAADDMVVVLHYIEYDA